MDTAVYITNRLPTTASLNTMLYMLFFVRTPSLEHLHVFGSVGYVHVEKERRTKLDPKALKCMLLG